MFQREIENRISGYKKKYKAIALVGPRQSGKTTLAKHCFPNHEYISLENPDRRLTAVEDPRGFLHDIKGSCILDEIQNAPNLLSYLQEILDNKSDTRQFILTGSNSLKLNEEISQSLAGRVRILTILPLSHSELPEEKRINSLDEAMYTGLYPRIFDEDLNPNDWSADYYQTYIQKDVRTLLNVKNLAQFDRFVRICAGRVGQLCSFSSMSGDVGVSQPTAVEWTSILEASYILFKLQPHFNNFNKRVIKSPKLYFYDTGLLCYLLRINSADQLISHPLRGAIFENWIISSVHKQFYSNATEPPTYFWRDQHGHEIDLILDQGQVLFPIEIKSAKTFSKSWVESLDWFNKLQDYNSGQVLYGGEKDMTFKSYNIRSWNCDNYV